MKNKNNIKIWQPIDIWTKHLTDLETTGTCSHVFSQSFTLEQRIEYCNKMINIIKEENGSNSNI